MFSSGFFCSTTIFASFPGEIEPSSFSRPTVRAPINVADPCLLCGATDTYKDEVITDDRGGRMFICSDTDHCEKQRPAQ